MNEMEGILSPLKYFVMEKRPLVLSFSDCLVSVSSSKRGLSFLESSALLS